MKYSEVASAHRQPEPSPSISSSREPLLQRLYFKAHLTDLIRTFGYDHVPLADAQQRLGTLRDRYGARVIDEAVEELLDVRSGSNKQFACLKDNVRNLALGILGRPPADAIAPLIENATAESSNSAEPFPNDIGGEVDLRVDEPNSEDSPVKTNCAPAEESTFLRLVPHDSPDAEGKPVQLSRREMLVQFEDWLTETAQPFEVVDAAKQKELAGGKLATLDFILDAQPQSKLVTVRPKLSVMQIHDMQEWQRIFGSDFDAARVWPVKNHTEWIWTAERILPARESMGGVATSDATKVAKQNITPEKATGPAPHKAMDFSHVSHRLDLLQEEMDGLDERLQQADKIQRQLRTDLEAVRDQLRRGTDED